MRRTGKHAALPDTTGHSQMKVCSISQGTQKTSLIPPFASTFKNALKTLP